MPDFFEATKDVNVDVIYIDNQKICIEVQATKETSKLSIQHCN